MQSTLLPFRPRKHKRIPTYPSHDWAGGIRYVEDPLIKRVPLGYVRGPDPHRVGATIVPDNLPACGISKAFAVIDVKGYSLRKALDIATAAVLRSRRGTPLPVSSLWHILTNPFYAGLVRKGEELSTANFQPLVSLPRFKRVQQKLAEHKRRGKFEEKSVQNNYSNGKELKQKISGFQK